MANLWHPITLNFWNNFTLSYYQQRLAFAHLHKAERLHDIKKDFPKCKTCNVEASWEHVFWKCKKVEVERKDLHRRWDILTNSLNLNPIRITENNIDKTLCFSMNGIVFFSSWNSWTTTLIDIETQDKIYREYVIFVENCYKNSEWNSNSNIREQRNYQVSSKSTSFATTWQNLNNNTPQIHNEDNV